MSVNSALSTASARGANCFTFGTAVEIWTCKEPPSCTVLASTVSSVRLIIP